MTSVLPGFLTGLVLIVAIGAQNAFVLRQGLRREHVTLVVAVCAFSDAVLVATGVAGLGRLLAHAPWFADAARWGGAAFLTGYGLLAARRALVASETGLGPTGGVDSSTEVVVDAAATLTSAAPRVVATAVALTWLNPHVYLDTVVLLGSVATTYCDDRWWFGLGAVVASVTWFATLGWGAGRLGRWLRGPRAWRAIDACVAVLMLGFAARLATG